MFVTVYFSYLSIGITSVYYFCLFEHHFEKCVSNCITNCVPQIIKVYSEDGVGKVVEVPGNMTARDVCQFLVYKNHCLDDNCWCLVEHHSALGLGKQIRAKVLIRIRSVHTQSWRTSCSVWGRWVPCALHSLNRKSPFSEPRLLNTHYIQTYLCFY